MIRCVHVIDTLGVGGAEQALVNLLGASSQVGLSADVVVCRPPYDLQPALEAKGIKVHRLNITNKWNTVSVARQLADCADCAGASIVHAHLLFPSLYAAALRTIKKNSLKTCLTYHNLAYAPGCNRKGVSLSLRKTINCIVAHRGMDGVLAVSQAVCDHMTGTLGVKNVCVLPNAVPVSEVNAVAKEKRQTLDPEEKQTPTLVVPGRLVHEKGHADFLRALPVIRKIHPDARAIFAGGGPMHESLLQEISRNGLCDVVTITGQLSHNELLGIVAGADLVVIPSRFEGFGLVAAEAMALGKTVVAANVGGLAEVIQHGITGYLVDTRNATQTASIVAGLLSARSERDKMGTSGLERVTQLYDAPIIARRLKNYYSRFLMNA